jgi:hypothetical protein
MGCSSAHRVARQISARNIIIGNGTRTGPLSERHELKPESTVMTVPRVAPTAEFDRETHTRKKIDEE